MRPRQTRWHALTVRTALLVLGLCAAEAGEAALPNWSGIWEVVGLHVNASGTIDDMPEQIRKVFGGHPPYTPSAERAFQDYRRKLLDSPDEKYCTFGFPNVMLESPLVFEVLITPQETVMIFSAREIRHIYTDGRPLPPEGELFPTHWGSSIGHWEGQTLVIETVATEPELSSIWVWDNYDYFDVIAQLGAKTRYTERLRMVGKDLLEDQLTIFDPERFTGPWTLTHRYRRAQGISRMIHEDCEGPDRNPVVNGKFTLK